MSVLWYILVYVQCTHVFSFSVFTATTVLFSSITDYLKVEISSNNYPGILRMYRGNIGVITGILFA